MQVTIRLQECSNDITYFEVTAAYTKGKFYCIRLSDNTTIKYPINNLFSVEERLNVKENV